MQSELSDGEIVDSDSDVNENPVQQQNGFMVEDWVFLSFHDKITSCFLRKIGAL